MLIKSLNLSSTRVVPVISSFLFSCVLAGHVSCQPQSGSESGDPKPAQSKLKGPKKQVPKPKASTDEGTSDGGGQGVAENPLKLSDSTFVFPSKVTAFEDQSQSSSLFFLGEKGESWRTTDSADGPVTNAGPSFAIDSDCGLGSQNTSFTDAGMTLASPFFVGLGKVCLKDEGNKTIRKVADFKLPEDSFSVTYLAKTETDVFFVLNNKPFRTLDEDGQISVIKVSLADSSAVLRPVLSKVPGYSGAMRSDGTSLFVASSYSDASGNSVNDIFAVDSSLLLSLFEKSATQEFLTSVKLQNEAVEGLSLFLLNNQDSLLFLNSYDPYESFTLTKAGSVRSVIDTACTPVSGWKTNWAVLCEGVKLKFGLKFK